MSDTINAAGLALIKQYEGLRLTAYQDSVGVWTVGYGHTGKVDGVAVCKGMKITSAKAEELLKTDVKKFWDCTGLTSYVPVTAALNENQRSALTSFAFNCGQANLKKLCKNRTVSEIADAMLLYNKAGGKVLSGLVNRRKAERELYLTGTEVHDMDTLRNGDKGQQVTVLQILLNYALGCGLDKDGVFGSKTEDAVEQYQESQGLTVDGIVGENTWSKLLG
ncbi:MAG: peptidoglycan-binding protein [Clostridiales bacterium]|nr:peptidoglycan-binding protein [Clostridiales bacterium]